VNANTATHPVFQVKVHKEDISTKQVKIITDVSIQEYCISFVPSLMNVHLR